MPYIDMIMPKLFQSRNRVKLLRETRGWSQADLARRSGLSRAAVSAIEVDRLVTSVANALALADALACSVEYLFGPMERGSNEPAWAFPPTDQSCRYWQATVNGRVLLFPTDASGTGVIAHDGVHRDGVLIPNGDAEPAKTLVMACCDPAANLLVQEMARRGFRLLVISRPSRRALDLLRNRQVHVAGLHLATAADPNGNINAISDSLGTDCRVLRVARWDEGLTVSSGTGIRSVRAALRANLRWVGRESGSAARQCQDEILPNRTPRRVARDHRGVAEAVRAGWADIGVCLRLSSHEAGLRFLPVRGEFYDLCFLSEDESDPRIQALIAAVRSASYRQTLRDLPGFDTANTGETRPVKGSKQNTRPHIHGAHSRIQTTSASP